MRLKSMEIFGFKSFADKTKVVFEPGVTVIVGPNGCGKSNIVDALKWVLGEKQARNIRGEKMEDVIFNGTEQRKPLSVAEVTMAIDNASRVLGYDSDTVVVTRRVFRDGESEYLINKASVRLKDIEQLFMDTGIGKSSYSIMEQGKIDMILSTRAEDRRYIFEEAAGISRYKMQRRDSHKKLEETNANLQRINDIISEIARERDAKSNQAEKTKQYLKLKNEHTDLDVRLNVMKARELAARREKLGADIERCTMEREAISSRVSAISAENERDEKNKNDIQLQLFELDKELHTFRIRVTDIDDKSSKNRRLIEEQKQRLAAIERTVEERLRVEEGLSEEIGNNRRAAEALSKTLEEDRARLAALSESRTAMNEGIRKERGVIEQARADIEASERRVRDLRNRIEVVLKRLIDAIEQRKAELTGSESERQEVRRRIDERLASLEGAIERAIGQVESGSAADAVVTLRAVDVRGLADDIGRFEGYEDGFRSILFDKTGIHAEKEELDRAVKLEADRIVALRDRISASELVIKRHQGDLETLAQDMSALEKEISRNESEINWMMKNVQSLEGQIADIRRQIAGYREDSVKTAKLMTDLQAEIEEWERNIVAFNEKSKTLVEDINVLVKNRDTLDRCIVDRKQLSKRDSDRLRSIVERIGDLDKSLIEVDYKLNGIGEYLWTEYERKIEEFASLQIDEAAHAETQRRLADLKREIQSLGPINNLAIEEYKGLQKRYEYYTDQKRDIEKARDDIYSVIEDINRTSIEMFTKTYIDIRRNFSEIFKQLFEGGQATLELTDPENVLESGIEIMVRPPGKKPKSIDLLSGGERALVAVALLFATYMEKPSPFCFLDEIDAPLDEQNIGRFIKMLREFTLQTQFVIVSHNKKTMSTGESIYGVTMEEPGVSKVVSLRMEKVEVKPAGVT